MEKLRRTTDLVGPGTAIRAQREYPGWAVLYVGGAWFIGHPADFPRSAVACRLTVTPARAVSATAGPVRAGGA
jgi:hypothetical protein